MRSPVFVLLCCLLFSFVSSAEATTSKFIAFSDQDTLKTLPIAGSPFCVGTTLTVAYQTNVAFSPGNVFSVQLSSNRGSFTNPRVLATVPGTTSGSTEITLPTNLSAGTAYRIRVVASKATDKMVVVDNGQNITIGVPPATPVITSNSGLCAGTTLTLSANSGSGATYSWTGPNGFTASGRTISRPNADISFTGTYTVTTKLNGCSTSNSTEITIKPSVANAGPDRAICFGESLQLEATGGVKYSWTPSASLSDATIANPIAVPTATTTYTVTVTNENGCVRTDQVVVTVNPLPVVTLTPAAPAICLGSSVQLQASGAANYSWSPAIGLSDPTIANPIASPTVTTTYTLTATSSAGCQTTKVVTVKVNPIPKANAGFDKIVCSRQGTMLGAPAISGNTYSWSPVIGLNNPKAANPTLTYPSDNTEPITVEYTLTVTSNGCSSTDVVKVTVNPAAYAGPDVAYCVGGSAQLQATGGLTYKWSPATGLSDPNIANPVANPAATTTYTVTITNPNGTCAKTDQIKVTVNPLPTVTATTSAPSVCLGGSVTLTATGGTKYLWEPATGLSDATSATPTASPTQTTTYQVTATNATGCSRTAEVTVQVNELPAPTIQASGSLVICPGSNVVLTATEASSYLWSTGATTRSITVTQAGAYTVAVTNVNGCTATSAPATVTIVTLPQVTLAPFTGICKDRGTFALTGGLPAGGTYSGPGISNNQFNTTEAGEGTHTITYTYTTESGCSASATATIMVGNCLGVADEVQAASLKTFPNPTQSTLSVTVTMTKKEEVTLRLTDLKGNVLYRTTLVAPAGELKHQVPVQTLPQGIYLLQYQTAAASSTRKIVIAR